MSIEEDLGRVVASGLDFNLRENKDALISYLTNCEKVLIVQCQPSGREDGSLVVQFAPSNGRSASEVARLLSKRPHTVQSSVIHFSMLPSQSECTSSCYPTTREVTSHHPPYDLRRRTGNARSLGRGRGMWRPIQSSSLSPYLSVCGHGSSVDPHSSERQSSCGHAVRMPSYGGSSWNEQSSPSPSSLYGTGRRMPSGQSNSSMRALGTLSMDAAVPGLFQAEKNSSEAFSSSYCQGTREGLDIIKVHGLPPHATEKGLLTELQLRVKSAQSDLLCKFDVVQWDRSKGEARLHMKDMKAVFALWRSRHKSPLKYDGHVLSWDVAMLETYEEKRILVEGLTEDITPYKLILHIQSTGWVSGDVQMQPIFLEDRSKALINFDDTIVDSSLVDNLNEKGSDYEGSGEKFIRLVYSLLPFPRSVRLSRLDDTIDKGALRNYFNILHQKVSIRRPLFVDHIQTSGDGFAIIEFRTVEDCQEVLALSEMPVLGSNDHRPAVELYWKYPNSEVVSSLSSDSVPLATSSHDKETACAKAVEITPDDPVVFDYIWSTPRHTRRLKNALNCNDMEWNSRTLTILKPLLCDEEYRTKFYDFTDGFCCKKLLISDARLWEKSVNFVEHEMATRSCEGKLICLDKDLKILFVGPETEVALLHQYCGNVFSGWRTQLEEETAEIKEVVSFPSIDHLSLLQHSPSYGNIVEEVAVVKRQLGSKAYLDVKGPRNLVYKAKQLLLEAIQAIVSIHVRLDSQVIKFLSAAGLMELNALYEGTNIAALAVEVEEISVRLLVFPEARDVATGLAKETYTVVSVNSTADEEVQRFIRSEEYHVFVNSLCEDMVVMLDPQYEDIKASQKKVKLSVVGKASAAAAASKRLESFLLETVVYAEQYHLDHPGVGKFLRTYKVDELNELKIRLTDVKAEIDMAQEEDVIMLRSTKPGLTVLRDEIEKLLRNVKCDVQDVKKHGLMRFLRSASFRSEQSQIERENEALVWVHIKDDVGDDTDEGGHGSGRRSDTVMATTTKLGEYEVRNSSCKRISLYTGDICRHNVDVIVTEATEDLECVGGLAKHILDCVGMALKEECENYVSEHKKLPTGNAMYTSAGRLTSFKHIIHAVGPHSPLQSHDTLAIRRVERELESAVKSSLELATLLKCKTLAFPAIGSEMFGCPADLVAKQVIQTSSNFLSESVSSTLTQVHIVLSEADTDSIRSFTDRMKRDLDSVPKTLIAQSKVVETTYKNDNEEAGIRVDQRRFNRSCRGSSVEAQMASVAVIASTHATCRAVQTILRDVFSRFCVSKCEDIENIPDGFDTNELETLAASSGVNLKLYVRSEEEATAKVTLSGFIEDVTAVYSTVLLQLKALKEETGYFSKECILEQARWSSKSDDGSLQPYSVVEKTCSRLPPGQNLVNNIRITASEEAASQGVDPKVAGVLGQERMTANNISRQGVTEVQMAVAADEVALLETMNWKKMRVGWTVNDGMCTLYGLQGDLDAAQTKVKRDLELSKAAAAATDRRNSSSAFFLPGGQKVVVKKGDIIYENVDVIVNAANDKLQHMGGVAAAIRRAAGGQSFQEESNRLVKQQRGSILEGQAVYTSSGSLPFKVIVHAVPPQWSRFDSQHTQQKKTGLLTSACYNSLRVTDLKGGTSVAIPGLGSGIFGIPKEVCAQALMSGTEEFFKQNTSSPIRLVVFVDVDDTSVAAFMAEAKKRFTSAADYAPPVRRDVKPKEEGVLTQLAKAGRFLKSLLSSEDNSVKAREEGSDEQCPICIDRYVNVTVKCSHRFCKKCIDQWAKEKTTCPICGRPFGKVTGNQPAGGTMLSCVIRSSLPGYERCGTIVITYNVPSGQQESVHPNPGKRYSGAIRTAYLPDSKEGKELLVLLRKAFEARLVFTVERSVTSEADNAVIWNDIHHKTSTYGGPTRYGYPDPTYLRRLREDLKVKGIE